MDNNNDNLSKKELLQIEGYRGLLQYGCQVSQDHTHYNRILLPLSFVPAVLLLTSEVLQQLDMTLAINLWRQMVIWMAGPTILTFWASRYKRTQDRLVQVLRTIREIEYRLGFAAIDTVEDRMEKQSKAPKYSISIIAVVSVIALGYIIILVDLISAFGE